MDFKPGDIVVLKSGNLPMTVQEVEHGGGIEGASVTCVWSEQVGRMQTIEREIFPAIALKTA